MADLYRRQLRVRAEHVDLKRRMRLSTLVRLFQECCIAHTEELGMGRGKTLDRGFLWVIVSEHLVIDRMPLYDEEITLECRPGERMHYLFPRSLVVRDKAGNAIVRANSMWTLIDMESRQMIDPEENGIVIEGSDLPDDVRPVMTIMVPEGDGESHSYHAGYSIVDINGHVNNASYVDLATDILCQDEEDPMGQISEVMMIFRKEIPYGSDFKVIHINKDKEHYFKNDNFTLRVKFRR